MYRRHVRARYRLFSYRARRFVLYKLLHADDPPYKLAMGVAIGVFVTFTPTIGLQMALCVLLAWMLRANALVGIPIVWISNPVTFVPIYYPLYLLGAWLVGTNSVGIEWFHGLVQTEPERWWPKVTHYAEALLEIAGPLWAGCLFFATLVAIPSYFVTYYAVWGYRMNKFGALAPPGSPRAEAAAARAPAMPNMRGRRLVLASASPRRADLLREAGYEFDIRPSPYDESELDTTGMSPRTIAAELAHRKARTLADAEEPGAIVIAADTLLAIDDRHVGKPADADDARRTLALINGRPHEVITAVCLVDRDSSTEHAFVDVAAVTLGPIDDAAIDTYVKSGEWRGKAGGYNLAELRERWPFAIEGDATTVIGLPMQRLADELRQLLELCEPPAPTPPSTTTTTTTTPPTSNPPA